DDLALLADPFGRDLAPAAGRATEIDDAFAGRQKMKFLIELDQLERGARAITLPLGLGDIRVVELALKPERRRKRTLTCGLDAHRRHAAAGSRGFGGHAGDIG